MFFAFFFTIFQGIQAAEPASTTIPLSVKIDQMEHSNTIQCTNIKQCQTGKEIDPICGKSCRASSSDYFQYKFKGVQFQVYGTKNLNYGSIKISLSGIELATVQINDGNQAHTLLYTSDVLEYGEHTIKVTGTGNFEIHKFAYWPSVNSKRLNATDMGESGNWRHRTDEIGGIKAWTNTDSSLAYTMPCTKIWIYGTKALNYGVLQVDFNNRQKKIDTSSDKAIDGVLLYESDNFIPKPYTVEISNPNEKEIMFYTIYYEHADIPTQTPNPDITPDTRPKTQDDFIDKEYYNTIPKGFPDLTEGGDTVIQKITGCKFHNIVTNSHFYAANARVDRKIEFADNVFEYTDDVVNPTIFFVGPQFPQKYDEFKIERCTFTKFRYLKLHDQGLIFTFNFPNNVYFESCTFNNNGKTKAHFLIKLNGEKSKLNFQNCIFNYDDPDVGSRIAKSFTSDVTINNCKFNKPPRDMVSLTPDLVHSDGTFRFTNNVVEGNTKQFMMIRQLRIKPVVEHNIFQNINMESGYLISIINRLSEIELFNNTFSHITNRAKSYCGGISAWFQNERNNKIHVKFTQCYFYDITNNKANEFSHGGAFQYGHSTSISETTITLDGCEFKRNSSPNGNGGALSFSINYNLAIKNCVFEDNVANNGGAIHFWSEIKKPSDNSEAPEFSGPIKIDTISITNCRFIGNKGGSYGEVIYVQEDYSLFNAKIEILDCNFKDNGQGNRLIYTNIGNFDFNNNIVEFTDLTKSSGILEIKGNFNVATISDSQFTNCWYNQANNINFEAESETSTISISKCQFHNCKSSGYDIGNLNAALEVDSCTFSHDGNEEKFSCGAITCNTKGAFTVKNSNFIKTYAIGAISFTQISSNNNDVPVLIDNCMFDNCMGENTRCINLFLLTTDFKFQNTLIQNMKETDNSGYVLGINGNFILETLSFNNITFQNNRCNSEYGGGSGIWLPDIKNLEFTNCHWINNFALKSPKPRDKTPAEATDVDYYSGDGGAVQYGFSDAIFDCNMYFNKCEFKGNQAVRHGGALALQTVGEVTITECTFTGNTANYQSGISEYSSKLLADDYYNNYYSKKTRGRGGAIYINPAFNNVNKGTGKPNFDKTKYMKSVTITGCQITENSAFDGYAMYIQGDDPGTKFEITGNSFTDNYDPENKDDLSNKAVILSEISSLQIPQGNTFKYTDLSTEPTNMTYGDPSDTEDDSPDTFEIINITTMGRHEYIVKDNSKQIISIVISHFSNINSGQKDGGALYIVNAGLACQDIEFTNCSTEGRGGAIFAHNSYETSNYVSIIRNNINQCEGSIGGGAFVYSSNKNNRVTIRACNFIENTATKEDKNSGAYGGGGLFIAAKNGIVKGNYFEDNRGPGGSLQYYNKYNDESMKILSEDKQGKFIISECKFVQRISSSTSLFYSRGKGGILVELSDCSFEGDLEEGQHFIGGETLSNDSPKMIVKNCKFSESASKAITLESDFLSIDMKGQVFASQDKNIQEKARRSSRPALIVVVSTATITLIAIIGFLLFTRKVNAEGIDDNEMSL